MKLTKSQLKQIIKEELEAVTEDCWDGYERVPGTREGQPGSCRKKGSVNEKEGKKDACYHKVKARYDVWPSAYASGALVKCRKVGAANWGEGGKKKNEAKKQSSEDAGDLHGWFARKGEKGSKGGWVDCKAPDGDGGYKECAQGDRKKKPYCRPTPSACKKEPQNEGINMNKQRLKEIIMEELAAVRDTYGSEVSDRSKASRKKGMKALGLAEGEYYVDALDENEEYCPDCAEMEEAKKKKACKPSKGKRFAKRVDGKCRSYGQAGQAKGGGDRIRPGTKKGDAYCARSAGIKKCKNPPCANTLSRKKWKCRGKKSMKS